MSPRADHGFIAKLLGKSRAVSDGKPGIYLGGGFGVGKTHLLASLWQAAPGPKAYCTFVELTQVAGALGFAATSNTLPDRLGEGRFCADDFIREIRSLSAKFDPVRVDSPDFRHRDNDQAPDQTSGVDFAAVEALHPGATCDDFVDLCRYLATIHPPKDGRLVGDVPVVGMTDVKMITDHSVAQ